MAKQPWPPVEERFWSHVPDRTEGECWIWTGVIFGGYGKFYMERKTHPAHRVAWEFHHGRKFPEGKLALHRCNVKNCVNPEHVYPGTPSDNARDLYATGWRNANSRQTHCKRGHPLSGDNVIHELGRGGRPRRRCHICNLAKTHESWVRRHPRVAGSPETRETDGQ